MKQKPEKRGESRWCFALSREEKQGGRNNKIKIKIKKGEERGKEF